MAYSGDGCTCEGPFYEAMNMATAFKLPLLMIIQNNFFAISEDFPEDDRPPESLAPGPRFVSRVTVENGNDAEAVYNATKSAVDYVRAGNGPMILEIKTWRQMGHAPNEAGTKYKDPDEQAMWMKRDPIKLQTAKLKEQYQVSDERLAAINAGVERELDEAWAYAEAAPYSEPEIAMQHIYAEC